MKKNIRPPRGIIKIPARLTEEQIAFIRAHAGRPLDWLLDRFPQFRDHQILRAIRTAPDYKPKPKGGMKNAVPVLKKPLRWIIAGVHRRQQSADGRFEIVPIYNGSGHLVRYILHDHATKQTHARQKMGDAKAAAGEVLKAEGKL